jgi:chloride channel 7
MRVAHLKRRSARSVDSGSASFLPDVLNAADEPEILLDVAGFMHRAPLCVHLDHPATRVHLLFTTLGLRHLCVVDSGNRVAGVITRKDVTRAELGIIE